MAKKKVSELENELELQAKFIDEQVGKYEKENEQLKQQLKQISNNDKQRKDDVIKDLNQ